MNACCVLSRGSCYVLGTGDSKVKQRTCVYVGWAWGRQVFKQWKIRALIGTGKDREGPPEPGWEVGGVCQMCPDGWVKSRRIRGFSPVEKREKYSGPREQHTQRYSSRMKKKTHLGIGQWFPLAQSRMQTVAKLELTFRSPNNLPQVLCYYWILIRIFTITTF